MIKVSICRSGQFERSKAYIIESLVIKTEWLISILHQLMNREGRIVRFYDSIWNLGGGHHTISAHYSVGVFFPDFRNDQSSEAGSRTAAKRM
jgi:hypothetical protein